MSHVAVAQHGSHSGLHGRGRKNISPVVRERLKRNRQLDGGSSLLRCRCVERLNLLEFCACYSCTAGFRAHTPDGAYRFCTTVNERVYGLASLEV